MASALVTFSERNEDRTRSGHSVGGFFREFMDWFYWSVTTVMGAGDASAGHTRRSATWSAGC